MATAPWRGRIEDEALLRGKGRFAADEPGERRAIAWFVRSPHACARIGRLDARAAARAPGVLAVLTAADMAGLGSIARPVPQTGRDGAPLKNPFRPARAAPSPHQCPQPLAQGSARSMPASQWRWWSPRRLCKPRTRPS
jgi:carbon-monoxide dehydrogenase large subunit